MKAIREISPYGSLTESNGKLWGTTSSGGAHGEGVIFSMEKDASNYKVVHDFSSSTDGNYAKADLYESNGKLWGTTPEGGINSFGIVFSIGLDGKNFNVEHNFEYNTGVTPAGNLVESNGKLWGLAEAAGSNDGGVIFTINTDGSNYNVVHSFSDATNEAQTPQGA